MKIDVLGAVPIPVGHRVSVRWYHKKSKGLFGGEHDESHPDEPTIDDLDTGIVYAFDWMYDATAGAVPEGWNPSHALPLHYSEAVSKGVEEQRVVVGRITACRIFTSILGASNAGTCLTQTELTILADNEASAYR